MVGEMPESGLRALERIAALLDGTLGPEERDELLAAIVDDEELYRIFVGAIDYLTSNR
jgi:hypothetical protein